MAAPRDRYQRALSGKLTREHLDLLVCPVCRGNLELVDIDPAQVRGKLGEGARFGLCCEAEDRVFPIVDGVPYLIREAAFLRSPGER